MKACASKLETKRQMGLSGLSGKMSSFVTGKLYNAMSITFKIVLLIRYNALFLALFFELLRKPNR